MIVKAQRLLALDFDPERQKYKGKGGDAKEFQLQLRIRTCVEFWDNLRRQGKRG